MNQREKAEQLRQATLDLAAAIANPCSGDETFRRYMDWISRFHHYSFGNLSLILSARPDATYVAGYQTWRRLGHFVKAGEKGIAILVPMRSKPVTEIDPETDQERVRPGRLFFGVGHVFDAAQTAGEGEVPNYKIDLGENAKPLLTATTIVAEQLGVEVTFRPLFGSTNGFSEIGRIVLNSSRAEGVLAQTAVHEVAHEILHGEHQRLSLPTSFLEAEAEAVAVVVMRFYGFEVTANGAEYIRSHGASREIILRSLDRIASTARTLIDSLNNHLLAGYGRESTPSLSEAACQA